jgi:hypothetical protein
MATRKHSHLHPRQFGRRMRKDPGEKQSPNFGEPNVSKTMDIDRPKIPKGPARHPHRRHAGRRTRRAR